MNREKPKIIEVIKQTSGKLHSWVRAEIKGKIIIIRKENNKIQSLLSN